MAAVHELTLALGAGAACRVLGLPRGASARHRARIHRLSLVDPMQARPARPRPPLAFDAREIQALLDALNSERFADTAPAAIHATLLDEGRYLGSVRTTYRRLADNSACRERRNQLTHPVYSKPELLAIAPNQVWSWDDTKVEGAGQVDLLPPVRDPRHLQPPSRGLAAGRARVRRPGRAAHRRHRLRNVSMTLRHHGS